MQLSKGVVLIRRFNEFVGRVAFVSRVLVWLKPFMAPLYSIDRRWLCICLVVWTETSRLVPCR
jgi:hypothetical protein